MSLREPGLAPVPEKLLLRCREHLRASLDKIVLRGNGEFLSILINVDNDLHGEKIERKFKKVEKGH